jgi:hypothetical protein
LSPKADLVASPEKREIEEALVSRTIFSYNSSPIQGEDHWKVLEADILKNLIISPLEKCGVNGDNGLHSFEGETGSESDRVLFCNSNIIKSCCSAI